VRLEPLRDERYARLNDAVCVLAAEARERTIQIEVASWSSSRF
jgi:hypothetical protein